MTTKDARLTEAERASIDDSAPAVADGTAAAEWEHLYAEVERIIGQRMAMAWDEGQSSSDALDSNPYGDGRGLKG